ncbi:MAG: DUF3795 domain-containing protein [Bacteroidota bacterium]
MESLNKFSLIAPCGMNCGICMAYLREKNKCPGCRRADTKKPITRIRCKIKTCTIFRTGKAKYCFECGDFPCDRVKQLDKRYRAKYSMSMIENLEYIRDYGIRKFLKNEDIRWTCRKCRGKICVHDGFCIECGGKK